MLGIRRFVDQTAQEYYLIKEKKIKVRIEDRKEEEGKERMVERKTATK